MIQLRLVTFYEPSDGTMCVSGSTLGRSGRGLRFKSVIANGVRQVFDNTLNGGKLWLTSHLLEFLQPVKPKGV